MYTVKASVEKENFTDLWIIKSLHWSIKMSSSMVPDAMRWEDNFWQELGKTFLKDQIMEYDTETSGIAKERNKFDVVYRQYIQIEFIYFKRFGVWILYAQCFPLQTIFTHTVHSNKKK